MFVFPESMNRLDKGDVPGSLGTIEEYIRYMCERVDFSTRNGVTNLDTLAATVAVEGSKIIDLGTELQNKVDKEAGKGLSSNDYTDEDKAELADHETRITALEDALSASGPILYQNAQDITAADSESVYFTVKVIYSSTVTYAWQLRWGSDWITPSFVGVNTDTLTVPATTSRNGYQFRCTITAGGFTIYSKTVTLHVT